MATKDSSFTDLAQLTICEVCLADTADRCHVRLRLATCPRCSALLLGAAGAPRGDPPRSLG